MSFTKFVFYRVDRKNKMSALASDCLRHFRLLLWNRWTEIKETWQEARSYLLLQSLCFSGRSEKQDGCPGLWLAETFSTSSLKLLKGIQCNLTGSKTSTSSTKFVFFGPIGKTRWLLWPLIGWEIFDFFSETAEWNSTKPDRMQDLNVLNKVCVFRVDRKNKMSALASDWLRHFRLLLWNYWKEFNETWQEARPQRPLPNLCLIGSIEKTRCLPWPLIAWDIFDFFSETAEQKSKKLDRKQDLIFLYQVCVFRADRKNKMAALASDWLCHFRLLLWNYWTEFNETWQEARSQHPLPSLCFIGLIAKTRWRPWPLIAWDIFDFFSETAEQKSKKLDRKQDLNCLYQVCVFRADWKNKMATLASDWLSHFRLLLWNYWTEFNETWQEARSQHPLPSLCFIGLIGKTRWRPWPLIAWDIFDFFSETAERKSKKLDRKQDLNFLYQVCVFRANRKNKMVALASDWLSHFRLLLWNYWTEFNETWQVLSGWSEKQDGGPGLWLSETFSTFSLKPLNGIQWKLTGSKISTSSTKFLFFGQIGKTRWPPWPLIGWDIFDFFSETAEWNSTKTWQEVRSQCSLLSLCF